MPLMHVLITGGSGFIGSHLSKLLLDEGHQVIVIDNLSGGRLANIKPFINNDRFKFLEADIRDQKAIEGAFVGVDWVFHLAGLADIVPSIEAPKDYYDVNVTGTFNVLESARAENVKRFVYAASSSSYGIPDVYPTPEDTPVAAEYPYALTKHMGEELVMHWSRVFDVPAVSLRLFNVYGPRSRTTGTYGAVFGVFLAQKLAGKPFTVVGDGTQRRDFTYVTDVARAMMMAAKSDLSSEFMNVGSGHAQTVIRLVELLGGDVVYIPKRPGEPEITFADTLKISKKLGWAPEVSFENGVAEMLAHIDDWRDAPVWSTEGIKQATESWFKYLGK